MIDFGLSDIVELGFNFVTDFVIHEFAFIHKLHLVSQQIINKIYN